MSDYAGIPVIAGLAVGIAFVILFASSGDLLTSNQSVYRELYMAEDDGSKIAINPIAVKKESCECIVMNLMDTETYLRESGRSVVKAEFLSESVNLQRGNYADVPLLVKHLGGDNSERYVTVRVMPPAGYTLYPKSVAETTTEEQGFEAAKSKTILGGGIDMAQFVMPGAPIDIQVGSQQLVNVRFVVPEDLPDEVDGHICSNIARCNNTISRESRFCK
jgi:hypothetical protein